MKRSFVLMLCACALPGGDVLAKKDPVTPFTGCEDALDHAQLGSPCAVIAECKRQLTPCCLELLSCESGVVISIERDCSDCAPCAGDDSCAAQTWCIDSRCEPCPRIGKCPDCPAGLVPLERNGCATCDCGPPSSCPTCGPGESCAAGAYCTAGCTGTTCCVKQCSASGCAAPNPDGCGSPCGSVSCAAGCFASGCVCVAGSFSCDAKCSPGAEVFTSRCKP